MSWTLFGYVAFIAILLLSVVLHEAGHFLTARRFGMKATEFFVGFGPRLWSFRRGETEYGVKAIPAGGYVRIVGMTELDEVDPADEERAFYRQPAPQRAIVLAAGSVVHFIIALLLFAFVPLALGVPEASRTIGTVSECVPAKSTEPCTPASQPSPAKAAGLRPGDVIVAVDGRPVASWEQATQALRDSGQGMVSLDIERDGQRLALAPVLAAQEQPVAADSKEVRQVPVLGVRPKGVLVRDNPIEAIGSAGSNFGQAVTGTFKGLVAIPAGIPPLVDAVFSDTKRSLDGPVGIVGIGRVSGEILGGGTELAARLGGFLLFMAGLNVFIGIFNLLPLLPLDGGHLAVLGYEKARERIYRMLGRPDPGRVDLAKLLPAAYAFLVLIIGLSVLLLAADIVNPISLNG
jgi:membrane-associated protease RseP (regulator of RpoE activity)